MVISLSWFSGMVDTEGVVSNDASLPSNNDTCNNINNDNNNNNNDNNNNIVCQN